MFFVSCAQVFSPASCGSSSTTVALLEFAQALRAADHLEDSLTVCGKLLEYCGRWNASASKHGVSISNGLAISVGAQSKSVHQARPPTELSSASRKRKHGEITGTAKSDDQSYPDVSFGYVEAAAWLCHGLNLQHLQQHDQASVSLRRWVLVLCAFVNVLLT